MDSAMLAQQTTPQFMEREISIAAAPERVWAALTGEVNSWWSHSYSENPRIIFEACMNGRFCEEFDDQGNGALFGTVIFCLAPKKIIFVGQMGLKHACVCRVTYELVEQNGGTLLMNSMETMGIVEPQIAEGYRQGWGELMDQLKAWIEEGKSVR